MGLPQLRGKSLIALILITSGFDFLLFGYDQGLFGGILAGERFQEMLGHPGATMSGLVTAIYDIGCALGAVTAFLFGERVGRKRSILYANFIIIIGATIQTASYSYKQMFVARIISGLGVGFSTVAVPILQSETLPAHNRGSLLVFQSVLIPSGVALASWVCLGTLYAPGSMQWRFPVACQILFSLCILVFCLFCPETPRWLAKHGKEEEARKIIARLLDKADDDAEVQGQLAEILDNIAAEGAESKVTWSECFSNATRARNLQRVLLGMGPYLFNQWSGANVLGYYMGYILETYLGYKPLLALILASVCFTQESIMAFSPYFFLDRLGRRKTVLISSTACAICNFIIAGALLNKTYSSAAAAVAFMFVYFDCYGSGILPVSWCYSAEVQPLRVRNKSMAVGVFWHWMSNFVIVMITPIGVQNLGGNFFWIWGAFCALFVPLTYFFGVETAGRTLEEVDQMFFDEPRICMGLNKNHTQVIRKTAVQEEIRFRELAQAEQKVITTSHVETLPKP
ncbi:uncharacterized protein PV07_11904 [Cladophialophora immunda]|uniref:Major facilitator superfamily (MFS) profile domain-containing protein n=1 Tax=Cladophialophora immunda TaxID=569365 RepID=A0A0D1Z7U6_9EURO|nr:uncharacterized protein PV07_11904 [Cladophialophora immunda]KIW23726.1 hypothetical protein PV07_11904 [Cladophialophora immunda]OQV03345.1 hypothetical protein CLAIMM_08397 [Cladophialophora immunda]